MNKSHRKKIRTMYEIGVEISEIARIFKITENDVLRICKGQKQVRGNRRKLTKIMDENVSSPEENGGLIE